MGNNKGSILSLKLDCLWSLALTLFFSINLNFDWRKGYIVWYGTLLLVVVTFLMVFNGRIQMKLSPFSQWMLSFIVLGIVSMSWSLSTSVVTTIIKTLIVNFVVLMLIQFSISFKYEINSLLKCYYIAVLINSVYVAMTIDLAALGDVQLGSQMLEGWNGNGIGFMTAQGALIGYYVFTQSKSKIEKVLYLTGIVALSFLTIYTGSRTAFIILVGEFVLYFWITHPSKMMNNIVITIAVLFGAYYLVMNVDSFYKVLGSRLEGLEALFSGEGKVDSSADIRNLFIENGKRWFAEQPIVGYGLNNYKVLNKTATGRFTYAHNNFIEIAVDLGIVGLVWYYFVYIKLIYCHTKLIKTKDSMNAFLLSAIIASLVSHYGTVCYYGFYQNFLLMLCFCYIEYIRRKEL